MCSCHDLWFLLRLILDACVRIDIYLYKLFHFGHIWTLDISLLYNQNDTKKHSHQAAPFIKMTKSKPYRLVYTQCRRSSCHCYQIGRLNNTASWLRQDFHEWGHCHINDLRIMLCARTEVEILSNIKTIHMVRYVDGSAMNNLLCAGWMLWKNNLFRSVFSHYVN